MKKMYDYLKEHLQADFDAKYYASIFFLLMLFVGIEEYLGITQKLMVLGVAEKNFLAFFGWVALYGFAYYIAMFLYSQFKKDSSWLHNPEFWLKSGLVIVILSLERTSWLQSDIAAFFTEKPDRFFASRMTILLQLNLALFIPVIYLYFKKDKELPFLYGMTFKGFDYKAYLPLILILIPGVLVATSAPHFNHYYPVCKPDILHQVSFLNGKAAIAIYEFFYANVFVGTEAVFRGILVIGLSKILGRNAILPMCCLYCCIHFSKPLGETLMSVPGGFILGILAHRTQNIIGGIWAHLTIALGMELFGVLL